MNKKQILLTVLGLSLFLSITLVVTRVILPQRASDGDRDARIPIVVTQPDGVSVQDKQPQLIFEPEAITLETEQHACMVALIEAPGKVLDGADAVIRFDPSIVNISDISNAPCNTIEKSQKGYFQNVPRVTVDEKNGIVKVSGFSSGGTPGEPATADRAVFFSFTMTGRSVGKTQLHMEYLPNRSDLSTLVEQGTSKNILTGTRDAAIVILPDSS